MKDPLFPLMDATYRVQVALLDGDSDFAYNIIVEARQQAHDTVKANLSEQGAEKEKTIYIFTHDGYRDSVDLQHYAVSLEGIKALTKKYHDDFGDTVDMNSFVFDEKDRSFAYAYLDVDNLDEKGKGHYIKMEPIA